MTSTWNRRIIKKANPVCDGGYYYSIHEVFYEDGEPSMCTLEGISPYGESLDELAEDYELLAEAFNAPVLDYDKDFPDEMDF